MRSIDTHECPVPLVPDLLYGVRTFRPIATRLVADECICPYEMNASRYSVGFRGGGRMFLVTGESCSVVLVRAAASSKSMDVIDARLPPRGQVYANQRFGATEGVRPHSSTARENPIKARSR